jgi:uncharacterized membrane protein YfcA
MAHPRIRRALAIILLVACVVCWPLSMIWWAKSEPPFVLSLSWLALILAIYEIAETTNLRVKQKQERSDADQD